MSEGGQPMEVSQLWRFPVKSMGGSSVDTARFGRRGLHADRLWAVRDLENDITASARRIPALLGCSARYLTEPGPDAGPGHVPAVVIVFPDGTDCESSDPGIHALLSEVAGRDVRLTALPPPTDTSVHKLSLQQTRATYSPDEVRRDFGLSQAEALPDTSMFTTKQLLTLARFATPPGTFVDLAPVHLLTSTSLASLSATGDPYDVRRFRPNVLVHVEAPDSAFPESDWIGARIDIGSAAMTVTTPTIRCVIPTRPQPGVPLDRGLTRRLVECTDRFLGVYADVSQTGSVRVGDEVRVIPAERPGSMRRTATAAGKAATRRLQRLLEATVLRSRD